MRQFQNPLQNLKKSTKWGKFQKMPKNLKIISNFIKKQSFEKFQKISKDVERFQKNPKETRAD